MRAPFRLPVLPFAVFAVVILCLAVSPTKGAGSSEVIQGDADCSGEVTIADAKVILSHTGTLAEVGCEVAADTNCSGGIGAADALVIVRYLAESPGPAGACTAVGQALGGVTVSIDSSLQPNQDTLPGLDSGPDREVASSKGPDGVQVDFVADEVVLRPDSEQALQDFLDKYNGVVLRDGTESAETGAGGGPEAVDERHFLIKVDPSTSPTGDAAANMEQAGLHGTFSFSDEDALRMAGLIAREAENGASINVVADIGNWNEHPTAVDGQGNPTSWMVMQNQPYISDSSLLSVGLDRAWAYMRYHLIPPISGTFDPISVGIVDIGFALDENTGKPTHGNLDYFYLGLKPPQYDLLNQDGGAGGSNPIKCSGGDPCPWHGQGSFGVCCARPHNNYGVAGTGGEAVVPALIKTDNSFYLMGQGIKKAFGLGADVISISMSGDCGFWCDLSTDDGNIERAAETATDAGRIVVSAAGNKGTDISDNEILPCKASRVICVGAINYDTTNAYNFGSGVDIWAPELVYSTTTPESIAKDADNFGQDELYIFNATSAATPFVAGIVALLKEANPNLQWDDIRTILQQTSNQSSDPRVTTGYVDALRAVMAARGNAPPSIQITVPQPDTTRSYKSALFRAIVTDPDPGAGLSDFDGQTIVSFFAEGQFVCMSNSITYIGIQPTYQCFGDAPPGAKSLEARVTDPFGAEGKDEIPVTFTEGPPDITILKPLNNSIWYSNQLIRFESLTIDPDEVPFPYYFVQWSSSIDGDLFLGHSFETYLSQGTHTVTATATDEHGFTDSALVTVIVQSGAGIPSVQITSPPNGASVAFNPFSQQFTGTATDDEDGNLTGGSLVWTSNIDGFLGTGNIINPVLSGPGPCSSLTHIITLTATDSDNHSSSHQITVTADYIC